MRATGKSPMHRAALRPTLWVAAVAVGASLGASCGLPEQEQAQVIADLPKDVLADASTTTFALAEIEVDAPFELALYWHESDQGRLIRKVRQRTTQASPQEAIEQLIAGPTQQEIAETEGVEVFLPNAGLTDEELAPVIEGPDVNGIVTVIVSGTGFRDLPNKANAAAELVCTLTEFDNIDGVLIRDVQPEPVGLVGTNSESIKGPARRENFDDCTTIDLPPGPTESTTTSGG